MSKPNYIEKGSRWGRGLIGKTRKNELIAQGRVRHVRVGRILYVLEPFADAMIRIAAEDAAAGHRPSYNTDPVNRKRVAAAGERRREKAAAHPSGAGWAEPAELRAAWRGDDYP
jgi:hypothetical protein